MIKTLADISYYFEKIAKNSTDIQSFVVGDSEQILSEDRSSLEYTVLWLETPTVSWELTNNYKRLYDIAFIIFINANVDDWKKQQYILHATLEITAKILGKLKEDHSDGVIKMVNVGGSQPILGYGHDHDYGYRTTINIETVLGKCIDCEFVDPCPVGAKASFTWENNNENDFTNLVLDNTSNEADTSGWTYTWSYEIDNGDAVVSNDVPAINLGSGSYIRVWLKMVKGNCTLYASAVFYSRKCCGESVPGLINIEWL